MSGRGTLRRDALLCIIVPQFEKEKNRNWVMLCYPCAFLMTQDTRKWVWWNKVSLKTDQHFLGNNHTQTAGIMPGVETTLPCRATRLGSTVQLFSSHFFNNRIWTLAAHARLDFNLCSRHADLINKSLYWLKSLQAALCSTCFSLLHRKQNVRICGSA